LAKANDVDDAIVFSGGHATNVNVIGHLFGPKDLIMHDELIHDSCLQGIKLSGAARRAFDHDTPEDLESQLRELRGHYEKVLVLIEGVYSMDGDIADVPEYIRIKKKYGCLLMIDEAHSFGTIGPRGLGVRDHFGFDGSEVDIWMGTMSKSLAAMGGWVAGREELITYLRYTTPGFVFAAGIPPTLGQAALSSLNLMLEEPERVEKLQSNSDFFFQELKKRGLNTGPAAGESPVIPVITGDSMQALQLSEILLEKGVNAKPIIYPAVPDDAARLRFFLSSTHSEEQLRRTAELVEETLNNIRNA
jgi:7-keto-8-aminopelargonate synthetase-like enzyme